ncbi:unnamed protein product [Dibothriocephalus latus]|uniref:Uncharacterized protein n=1 Tax=Dibothriocephalus latus TaxID=60516 RepID=A0A3P7MTF5_DIBLA|nr:unnamed protein product [Dibothriocephalus latus]
MRSYSTPTSSCIRTNVVPAAINSSSSKQEAWGQAHREATIYDPNSMSISAICVMLVGMASQRGAERIIKEILLRDALTEATIHDPSSVPRASDARYPRNMRTIPPTTLRPPSTTGHGHQDRESLDHQQSAHGDMTTAAGHAMSQETEELFKEDKQGSSLSSHSVMARYLSRAIHANAVDEFPSPESVVLSFKPRNRNGQR